MNIVHNYLNQLLKSYSNFQGGDCFGIRYIFGPKGTSKAEIYLKTQLDFERQNLFRLQVYALVNIRI